MFAFGLAPQPVHASELTRDDLQLLAGSIAIAHHLNKDHFLKVIDCESRWNKNAVGDHGESIGLVQIHLPSHPTVSREQALNPYFALPWMAEKWDADQYKMWTCWRTLNKQSWEN